MLDIGYRNFIDENRIRDIYPAGSSHTAWLRKEASAGAMLIDCTQGRKTNSLIVMYSGHLVLSHLQADSIIRRIQNLTEEKVNSDIESKKELKTQMLNALNKMSSSTN